MNTKRLLKPILIGIFLAFWVALIPMLLEFKKQYMHAQSSLPSATHAAVTDNSLIPRLLPTATPTPLSPLSVKQIIARSRELIPSQSAQLPQNQISQIIIVGDLMLGRAVNFNMHRKNDFGYPVSQVADKLKQADISIANLEAPILMDCPLTGEGMQLCSDYQSLYTLYFAGLDIVQIANNHMWDYGQAGIEETQKWIEFQGLQAAGLEKSITKQVRDTKFGFLAYNQIFPTKDPIKTASPEVLKQDIQQFKEQADVVIVGFHWGQEYNSQPNQEQRLLAKAAIDVGADVVFGHHPHWVQGIEVYHGKPIFYSLGNFVFDQMWSRETREGLAVELYFWQDQLVEVKLLPTYMNDFAQPVWQPVGIGNSTLGKIEKLSQKLADS